MGTMQFVSGDYKLLTAQKCARHECFLAGMEAVVPRTALVDLIEPHYPRPRSKGGSGRPLYPLERMLRIHLVQQ